MLTMLGQAGLPDPHSYQAIGWMVVILGGGISALLVIVNQVFKLVDRVKDKARKVKGSGRVEIEPQPLDVRIMQEYVRRHECENRHAESMKGFAVADKQVEAQRIERKEDMRELRQEIGTIAGDVSGLKTSTLMQNQQLARMDAKLDRIVENRLSKV